MRSISVELTQQELLLFLNTIRARSLYRPCSHGAAAEIWKPWMAPLLEKLQQGCHPPGSSTKQLERLVVTLATRQRRVAMGLQHGLHPFGGGRERCRRKRRKSVMNAVMG